MTLKIIFKCDDLLNLSDNVLLFDKIVSDTGIKASWGIVGRFLKQSTDDKYIKWIQDKHNSGQYEFWNHGFYHYGNTYEFKKASVLSQYRYLRRTQRLAKKRLGITMRCFGAPANNISKKTALALLFCHDIKAWFYGLKCSKYIFTRSVEIEFPVGHVNFEKFKNAFIKWGKKHDLIVYQLHPNMWGTQDFLEFKSVVDFLKQEHIEFVLPRDIYNGKHIKTHDSRIKKPSVWHRIREHIVTHSHRGIIEAIASQQKTLTDYITATVKNTNDKIAELKILCDKIQQQQNNIIDNQNSHQQTIIDYINIDMQNLNDTLAETKSKYAVLERQQSDTVRLVEKHIEKASSDFSALDEQIQNVSERLGTQQKQLFEQNTLSLNNLDKQIQNVSETMAAQQKESAEQNIKNTETILNATNEQHRAVKVIEQNLKDTNARVTALGEQHQNLHNAMLYDIENYWANVYHDTIATSSWLQDKSVSPGRWAVSYIVLYVLYRILDEIKPTSILECGLGQSSKLTIQYTDAHKTNLMICENNPEWLSFFQKQFPTADKYTTLLDKETVHIVPEYESNTYTGFKSAIGNKKFNLVLVDGPLGSQHYSRPEILDVVKNLDKSFVILLDDMNRSGERETWDLLKRKLTEQNILFKEKIYTSDKHLGLLCSPDLEYLTTL